MSTDERDKEKESESSKGLFQKLKDGVNEISAPVADTVKEKVTNISNQIATGIKDLKEEVTFPHIGRTSTSPTSANKLNPHDRLAGAYIPTLDMKLPSHNGIKYEPSNYRIQQFQNLLASDNVDLKALAKLSWSGVPVKYRNTVWQLLLGYTSTNKARRQIAVEKRRQLYHNLIGIYYKVDEDTLTSGELETRRQILKDLPRTCPDSPFFQQEPIQRIMERILYLWATRHPSSGYVQGMDDLLTPILYLSISTFAPNDVDVFRLDIAQLNAQAIEAAEADAYWCFTRLLDNIHDHYTFSQPGLQRMMLRLEDLIHRLDVPLHEHLQQESIQYVQFGFRWMNCLLLRELPFPCILRLWDSYISEPSGGFENFNVYVCAVILKTFQKEITSMPYEELLMFLQDLPTRDWTVDDMEPILSQAFILSTLFEDSPSHLN